MYKKAIYTLRSNERLTPAVWRMTLEGDTQWITAPGQFVNVELDGCYLRRPISVCDWDERTITLIYKVVGEGTALMAGRRPGARLDLLTGLGNGFDVTKGSRRELLVGGGVGVPPLYNLAKRLLADGSEIRMRESQGDSLNSGTPENALTLELPVLLPEQGCEIPVIELVLK